MSENTQSETEVEPSAGMASFAGLGCSVALFMFLGLAIWTVYVGMSQNSAISKFADAEQREYPIEEPSVELIALLDTKLKILAKAAETQRETTVEFSAEDINGLIATQDLLADFRGNARVRHIRSSHISIEMSQPLRKLPIGFWFVNGTYQFRPQEIKDVWQFTLLDIKADAGPVEPNFLEMFRELQLLRFDVQNENLRPVLKQLKSVTLADGKAIFVTWEGEPPKLGE